MGWADCGTDSKGRNIGYAFEGTCDEPGCNTKIDRGLSHACGGMHGEGGVVQGDPGCEGYYCAAHLSLSANANFLCQRCIDAAREEGSVMDVETAVARLRIYDDWASQRNIPESHYQTIKNHTLLELVRDFLEAWDKQGEKEDTVTDHFDLPSVDRPETNAWNVYLRGKKIDTVFFDADCTADYVQRSLVDHDNYDPGIRVVRIP